MSLRTQWICEYHWRFGDIDRLRFVKPAMMMRMVGKFQHRDKCCSGINCSSLSQMLVVPDSHHPYNITADTCREKTTRKEIESKGGSLNTQIREV